jgi:hypothetical protein
MTDLRKLQDEADVAQRRLIASSGEPQLIQEMASWLTFELEPREGEGQGGANHRLALEAKRRWPKSDHSDLLRAQELSVKATNLGAAILERVIDGHQTH